MGQILFWRRVIQILASKFIFLNIFANEWKFSKFCWKFETELHFRIGIGPVVKCNASTPSCFQIICFQIEKFREIAVCNVENVKKKYNVRLKIWLLKIDSKYLLTNIHMDTLQMFTVIHRKTENSANLHGETCKCEKNI